MLPLLYTIRSGISILISKKIKKFKKICFLYIVEVRDVPDGCFFTEKVLVEVDKVVVRHARDVIDHNIVIRAVRRVIPVVEAVRVVYEVDMMPEHGRLAAAAVQIL